MKTESSTWKKALTAAGNITDGGNYRRPLKDLDLTRQDVLAGRRIYNLRQRRAANQPLSRTDLANRMRRGAIQTIRDRYYSAAMDVVTRNIDGCNMKMSLDWGRAAAILEVEGWAQYSRSFGARYTRVVVLVVYDHDTHTRRAMRVGPQVSTVAQALDYLKPAAVKRAEQAGKKILRQGDFYFVPARRADFTALIGTRHEIRGNAVCHPEHGCLPLSGPMRAYRQMAVQGGWGGGRGNLAD